VVDDGGSNLCPGCDCVYHHCRNGSIKIDSPGPSECDTCRHSYM
jgi:hypothetical protein